MDRRTTLAILTALLLVALAPGIASAARGADEGLPNVDRRAAGSAAVPAAARAARRALERELGPLGEVRTERASGGVAYVGRATDLLTGPSRASPREVALAYVRDHGDVFGLTKRDFATLRLVARSVSPDGITHLRFNQVLDGIESFDSGIEAHVTRDGRLIAISGAPVANADLAGVPPQLSATAGLGAARQAVRGSGLVPRVTSAGRGADRSATFATGERARLRWSATATGPRLVWNVIAEGGDGHHYDVLVDAHSEQLLRRQDLTQHLGQALYFPRDPDRTPAQAQVTMAPEWYDEHAGGTRLWGQFARTYLDPADADPAPGAEGGTALVQVPASAGAPGAPDWLYTQSHDFPGATPCPATGCTWNSEASPTAAVNQRQAATNVHVLTSRFHDHLLAPPIGFDEASGNFERTNSAGQGLGGDYVRAEVNDGQTRNNANFATPPDGGAPRMQMFLFTTRDANAADVADIVYHEYGHGLSNRLVVNASGGSTLSSLQAEMMGEAWSDFYAMDLLEQEGSLIDTAAPGEIALGDYLIPGGFRQKPTDCPVAPAGPSPACNRNGTATPILGGYTYGDIANTNNTTPHNGGEVWAQTLWDIRTTLGRTVARALVTGAMRLSADDPSMLDMRDAILQQAVAMRSAPAAADDHYAALWAIFSTRGFGASASTPSADAANPSEAFDAPTGLRAGATTISDPYPAGDADGMIEPGEQFNVSQQLIGIGLADLPGVTGTLTASDAAVEILDASAAWPLLGRGRRAVNGDPLTGRLAAGSCAQPSTITIAVTSTEGPGAATARIDPRPGSNARVPITDNATATARFDATGSGTITDVDLRIDELRHTFLGDLRIELAHDGVTRTVFDPPTGYSGDDFIDAILDDESATPMPTAGPGPVSGRVRPSTAGVLAAFDGRPAAGTWTLRVIDRAPNDTGELRRWGLDGPQIACPRAEIPAAQTGAATDLAASAATLTGSVTPNGRATRLRFVYGPTAAYGSATDVQDVGAGDAAVPRSATITDLAPSTTYHFRVEAIRENGVVAVAGGDGEFTTPEVSAPPAPPRLPPPQPPGDTSAPRFQGGVRVALGRRVRGLRRPTFSFRLSERASVRVTLTRTVLGVRRGGRCASIRPRPGVRRCVRQAAAGSRTRAFPATGAARQRLATGGLRPGLYVAKLTATDEAGNRSRAVTVRFRVR